MVIDQSHCGYYRYNNNIYVDRKILLDDMLLYGPDKPAEFIFNDDVFGNLDWTIEPNFSLNDLYRDRAQQLRDSYDYLILSYSGGSDSHEVLNVFLDNKIFIDEVQVVHSYTLTKNMDKDIMMKDPGLSSMLEFEMVAAPMLKVILERSPNTKITLMDSSDFIVSDIQGHKFSFIGIDRFNTNSNYMVMTTPFVRNFFQHHQNNKNLKLEGKKVAFIRGTEKPNLKMYRNQLKFAFTDATMHGVKLIQQGEIGNIYNIENFFWSREAPFIPIKQSHIIKRVLENDAMFYAQFMLNQEKSIRASEFDNLAISHEQDFQRRYARIIYSHWNDTYFKAPKRIKTSGEFLAVKYLFNDTAYIDAMKELREFYYKKYAAIEDIGLLNKHMASQKYDIGVMNVKWN